MTSRKIKIKKKALEYHVEIKFDKIMRKRN